MSTVMSCPSPKAIRKPIARWRKRHPKCSATMARRASSRRGATMSPTARSDYARAAHKKDGETVVYSWVEWPDKETRAKGWEKMMTDERMKHDPANNPFDGAQIGRAHV